MRIRILRFSMYAGSNVLSVSTVCHPWFHTEKSHPPVAGIPEIDVEGTVGNFGDQGGPTLELTLTHKLLYPRDEFAIEAQRLQLLLRTPLIDHVKQQRIQAGVGEPDLVLAPLSFPQIRARLLADDRVRDAELLRKLPNLRFIQVAQRVEGRGCIAKEGPIPDQQLGL